jgi:hypothetical protein
LGLGAALKAQKKGKIGFGDINCFSGYRKENSGVQAFKQPKSRSSAKKHFRLRGNVTEAPLVTEKI